MIDSITLTDKMINPGEGAIPSPPPSSSSDATAVKTTTKPVEVSQTTKEVKKGEDASVELTPEGTKNLEKIDEKTSTAEETEKELNETIERLNEKLTRLDREIQLKVDKRIGKNYVSVVDKNSKEVIREFPPKEIRSFIARFMEFNERLVSETDLRSLIINLEV